MFETRGAAAAPRPVGQEVVEEEEEEEEEEWRLRLDVIPDAAPWPVRLIGQGVAAVIDGRLLQTDWVLGLGQRARVIDNVRVKYVTKCKLKQETQSGLKTKRSHTSELLSYLVGEVVAVHLVAVGLTAWTLNLDAVALQDGCFFKNTDLIIAYRPQASHEARKDACLRVNLLPRRRRKPPGAEPNGGGACCQSITSSRATGATRMARVAPKVTKAGISDAAHNAMEGGVTGIGLFQLVPAKEGPFLLLAEVGSLLQEPVGDPALTDPCRGDEGMRGEGRGEDLQLTSAGLAWFFLVEPPLTGAATPRGNRGGDSFPLVTAARPFWTAAAMVTGDATGTGGGGEAASKWLLGDSESRLFGKLVWVAVEVKEEEAPPAPEDDKDEQGGTCSSVSRAWRTSVCVMPVLRSLCRRSICSMVKRGSSLCWNILQGIKTTTENNEKS
ncbi:hypothetical protein EYF80_031026 [Liparis tanakae]|uniref:Uncharacterized protein n=1 Tax=Liparis tanakae TaxID=230148 RepID=A0A4Z2GZN5_9TELE|nr:hypothetical protein EYF80_031026 [Liparis tanakae]